MPLVNHLCPDEEVVVRVAVEDQVGNSTERMDAEMARLVAFRGLFGKLCNTKVTSDPR